MHITVLFSVCFDHFYSLVNPNKKADVKLTSQKRCLFFNPAGSLQKLEMIIIIINRLEQKSDISVYFK